MHPNPDMRRACRGTSLVEMLMFIAVFSMAIVMLSKIFVTTSRMSVYSTQIVDRMNAVREIQRDFTETVREAVAIVPGIGEHRTDDKTLVLQLHHDGAPERYAVLGMLDGQPRLCRMEVTGAGDALQADKYVMWRLPVAAAHFEVDAVAQRVTLTLDTQPHNPQKPDSGRTHRFIAALRTTRSGDIPVPGALKETSHER
jgi:hypothetical protein